MSRFHSIPVLIALSLILLLLPPNPASSAETGGNTPSDSQVTPGAGINMQAFEISNSGWVRTWSNNSGHSFGYDVVADNHGSIYMAGSYSHGVDLSGDLATAGETLSNGSQDAMVVKFSSGGSYKWGIHFGGSGQDYAKAVAIASDRFGNIYAGGYFVGDIRFEIRPGQWETFTSQGGKDAWLCKISSWGNVVWAGAWGGPDDDDLVDLSVHENGLLAAVGNFSGNVDFDPSDRSSRRLSNGDKDVYLSMFDLGGTHKWTQNIGGETIWDEAAGVAFDSYGNPYVAGSLKGTHVYFESTGSPRHETFSFGSSFNMFLCKYSPSGMFQWQRRFSGQCGTGIGGIAIDQSNNGIYVTGWFSCDMGVHDDVTNGCDIPHLGSSKSVYLGRFDVLGNCFWFAEAAGDRGCTGTAIGTDNNGSIYVTGEFDGGILFNPPNGPTATTSQPETIINDSFTMKYNSSGVFLWARTFGAQGNEMGYGVACDNDGNVYVVGQYMHTVNFAPNGEENRTGGGIGAYLMRYLPNGYWDENPILQIEVQDVPAMRRIIQPEG